MRSAAALACLALACALACASPPPPTPSPQPEAPPPAPPRAQRELRVTATAFNSVAAQTDGQPTLSASGERLRPGVRALAVSPDLEREGLDFGTHVEIDGYGEWVVLDRMAPRWSRKIDLYMGEDEEAARRFGTRSVTIRWSDAPP